MFLLNVATLVIGLGGLGIFALYQARTAHKSGVVRWPGRFASVSRENNPGQFKFWVGYAMVAGFLLVASLILILVSAIRHL